MYEVVKIKRFLLFVYEVVKIKKFLVLMYEVVKELSKKKKVIMIVFNLGVIVFKFQGHLFSHLNFTS